MSSSNAEVKDTKLLPYQLSIQNVSAPLLEFLLLPKSRVVYRTLGIYSFLGKTTDQATLPAMR